MKDIQAIIQGFDHTKKQALATLVKIEGSAYRRIGAKMLINNNSSYIGALSGGCLESDVVALAQSVIETGQPLLVRYDTQSEEDLIWGLGLGCQGVAYIFIEPLNNSSQNALLTISQCLQQRQTAAIATVFNTTGSTTAKQGERLILSAGGLINHIRDERLANTLLGELKVAQTQKKTRTSTYSLDAAEAEVIVEYIQPTVALIIFGAGFDALPLVESSKQLGWHTTVVDLQQHPLTQKRFAGADKILLAPPHQLPEIDWDDRTAAVVMSHNYLNDLEVLRQLLEQNLTYLGVLGPKTRTYHLLDELDAAEAINRIYSPVGLDIGADTPQEVALSIVSEIQAVMQQRQGGYLRDRPGAIHSR